MVDVSHIGFGVKKAPYKTRIIFVCHVMISMEKDNSFVLLVHQVPDILHLMTFHD